MTTRRPSSTLPLSHSQRSSMPSNHLLRGAASVGCPVSPSGSLRSPTTQDNVRTPSPNYFGLAVDSQGDPRNSGVGPKDNWSPPTSSIRSFNPQSPRHVPLDANPDFEAFRRQTEANNAFNLGHGNLSHFSSTLGSPSARSKSERPTSRSDMVAEALSPKTPTDGQSEASPAIPSFFDLPRQESPPSIGAGVPPPSVRRNILSHLDDKHPRLSLPSNRVDPPSPHPAQLDTHHRADTLPATLEDGPVMISSSELKDLLENSSASQLLVLDLRVAPQFSQSRIKGALNLCIPTTLLKRPSFDLVKLTDTFKVKEEKARFSTWKVCRYIVVYDARSTEKRDATSATNTLKKFTNEGWNGRPRILRGGIEEFSRKYPHLIDDRSGQEIPSSKKDLSLSSLMADVAPVAGGCEIPGFKCAANPFFSNIRQNMDLVGGVGQIDVKRPDDIDPLADNFLPTWLRKAAAVEDHGKTVAAKFLHIEQDELSRMQQALSCRVSYGTPVANPETHVQIAGLEKGGKNRYDNVWPFEHARVRLQGRPEGACDYVNASHIKASWSNKRYIASQGPLPSTFEVSSQTFGIIEPSLTIWKDFWSVIWDQDVRVIVMLTAESEGGLLKCHPYWAAKEYGAFKLKVLSEKRVSLDLQKHRRSATRQDSGRRRANTSAELSSAPAPANEPYVIVRKFTLSHFLEPFTPMREITQLHYSSWPDFGAPTQPIHLLGLVELSNSLQRAASSPVVGSHIRADDPEDSRHARPVLVHCSAGCGRTGTFCTVDSVIDMLKRQRKEHKSGVTPMEISSDGDYMAKSKNAANESGDWIFDEEIDLIQKTVEDFRKQRISMVQTLRQYVLCYETVLEWISQQRGGGMRERSSSETRGGGNRSS